MTETVTDEAVRRAVGRMRSEDCGFPDVGEGGTFLGIKLINAPLAALIEALASEIRSDEAGYGMDRRVLSPALDAVVRAINGEGER